ncbi:hypothetical protein NDU88_005102, partial [Pleurodeles waltl]
MDFYTGCGAGGGEGILPASWCCASGAIVVAYRESIGASSEGLTCGCRTYTIAPLA